LITIYEEGACAFWSGNGAQSCPYKHRARPSDWLRGYWDAERVEPASPILSTNSKFPEPAL